MLQTTVTCGRELCSPVPTDTDERRREITMSTIRAPIPAPGTVEATTRAVVDTMHRAVAAFTKARERSVARRIAVHLEGMSDVRLLDLGFSAADIEAIRAGQPLADVLARRGQRSA
jgi:uncharacterized protein YjiS (DUF1127 family)